MTALLTLEPREAGIDSIEPLVDFGAGLDELHTTVQCLLTAHFDHSTTVCYTTTGA